MNKCLKNVDHFLTGCLKLGVEQVTFGYFQALYYDSQADSKMNETHIWGERFHLALILPVYS